MDEESEEPCCWQQVRLASNPDWEKGDQLAQAEHCAVAAHLQPGRPGLAQGRGQCWRIADTGFWVVFCNLHIALGWPRTMAVVMVSMVDELEVCYTWGPR